MNKIYVGYDEREEEAYEICRSSILKRTVNSLVIPLKLENLPFLTRKLTVKDGKLWDEISQAHCATKFAISRFSIPFLEKQGWVLFMDCDMLLQDDIDKLFKLKDDRYAVMVVKHKQETGETVKMDNQVQSYYKRKNWSSVVLWNCNHPSNQKLTLEMLNTLPGRELHAFCWLKDEEIGELPNEWNHLVGVNPTNMNAKLIHYTLGGPWFDGWGVKYEEDIIWINEQYIRNRNLVVGN